MTKKILTAMSGGVDSAVAALLLKRQGYEVGGATMRLWDGMREKDILDARIVCEKLGIPHYMFDFREEFESTVTKKFVEGYASGVTPNPCVECNREIKFGAFLREARRLGYSHIATGHFARVVYDESCNRYRVRRAASLEKDQSYVLYSLSQKQLEGIVLPLGEYGKPEVRELARDGGLVVERKAESQDICFIPDGNHGDFLRGRLGRGNASGDFVDADGNVLGRHRGIWNYTIGQRKGIGISFERPMFVAAIDAGKNTVTLAPNENLFRHNLIAKSVNWIAFPEPPAEIRVQAKIRYGAKPADALVKPRGRAAAQVVFDEAQRAVTPGQSVVFYDGDFLVGGGIISE